MHWHMHPHLVQHSTCSHLLCTIELHQPPVRLFAMPMNTAEPTRLSTGVEYRLQSIVEEMVSLAWPECGVIQTNQPHHQGIIVLLEIEHDK